MATPTTAHLAPFARNPVVTRFEIQDVQYAITSVMDAIDQELNGPGEKGRREDTAMACSMIATLLDVIERQATELERHRSAQALPIIGSFP